VAEVAHTGVALRAPLWLRAAALISGAFAALHTLGRPWTPAKDVLAQGVVASMRAVHFPAAGLQRSYFEFYQGFGFVTSVFLGAEAVLLWQLSTLAVAGTSYRGMTLTHLTAFVALGIIAQLFIFWLPLLLSLIVSVCLLLALLRPPLVVRGG
jgi:hypothetical protein